jgi:hypothetical protein
MLWINGQHYEVAPLADKTYKEWVENKNSTALPNIESKTTMTGACGICFGLKCRVVEAFVGPTTKIVDTTVEFSSSFAVKISELVNIKRDKHKLTLSNEVSTILWKFCQMWEGENPKSVTDEEIQTEMRAKG